MLYIRQPNRITSLKKVEFLKIFTKHDQLSLLDISLVSSNTDSFRNQLWVAVHPASCSSENVMHPYEQDHLYRSNAVSCLRGLTEETSLTDFHSSKKILYKNCFIGNDCKIVGYLGKEL